MRPVSFQREIRNREAAADPRSQDSTLDYTVEAVESAEAREFVLRYEWLRTVGHPLAHYGARNRQGELAAVALFGRPSMTGAADICGPENRSKVIVLERGACAHWAHRHCASWFIPRACAAAKDHGWRIFL